MSNFEVDTVVWYIDGGQIRRGVLERITEPQDEDGETLYELGHGFSTPQIFKTQEEARQHEGFTA